MRSLLLVDSFDFRPRNQYILVRAIPSCFRFAKLCLCQVSLLSRYSPRLFVWNVGHVFLHVVNITWIDLDSLAFVLHFLNRVWIASRSVCSFCGAIAGSLFIVTTAVSLAKVAVVGSGEIAGIIMDLGHCLGVRLHWLMTVLCTQFQLLRGSVCFVNRILG
jgi:uncharacterized membrane protein